jgi:hypothetical protein
MHWRLPGTGHSNSGSPQSRAPSLSATARAAATQSLSLSDVTRVNGAATLTAARPTPWRSVTATAIEPTPSALSPRLRANPKRRTLASSRSNSNTVVTLRSVRAGRFRPGYKRRSSSRESVARSALPRPTQCAGRRASRCAAADGFYPHPLGVAELRKIFNALSTGSMA